MTKCEIKNDVDGMPQWISGELFTGSGKKYEDLKEKQVLVFSETMRGKDICWSAEWIDYFLCRYFKGLHSGIVLVVSLLMKDQVALLEEQTVNISLFA